MARLLICTLLLLALSAMGCRDALVDAPLDPVDPIDTPTEPQTPTLFVKGPSTMTLGASARFKGEIVEGAASYAWRYEAYSSGEITGTSASDGTYDRLFTATATSPGLVVLVVQVLDRDGVLLAEATKLVTVEA